jgi:hypothetical protein
MYAVVNTMTSTDREYGSILSRHRTVEAATAADDKLQRAVRRSNGQTSYLPTIICEGTARGRLALRSYWTEVDRYTGELVE